MGRRSLCFGTALAVAATVFSCGGYDSDPENKARCQTNMTVIWQKLRGWSTQKGGTPKRLGMIYPHPLRDRTLFRCPSSSDDPTGFEEGKILQDHQCSYIYNWLDCFTDLDPSVASKLILLYEKKGFHGPGRNVAFAGGDKPIRYLEKDEFDKALAFTKDWMKKNM
ncbi:MAG: hypothetical protein GXP25_04110 [Planctomycetes bacterium]|nr:hypothetical protein [Planctomycetota bacterium]